MRTAVSLLIAGVIVFIGGQAEVPAGEVCGARERVDVVDIASLLANIGQDNVEIVMAPGRYALPSCPPGVDEWSATSCGQLEQGQCSVLRSDFKLPTNAHQVPDASFVEIASCAAIPASEAKDGAVIDCAGLPASAEEFSCLVAGRHSAVADLTVCNGATPVPLAPGQLGTHRNGIMVLAGHEAQIEGVRVVNARRGLLLSGESDQVSRAVIRSALIEGTELAGVAFATRAPDDATPPRRTSRAQVAGHLESTRIARAGLHPILIEYGFGGQNNHVQATVVDNVVEPSSLLGVSIVTASAGTSNNTADVTVRGGRLEGNTGLLIQSGPPTGTGNLARASVEHVVFRNSGPAVRVQLAGAATRAELEFDHNRSEAGDPGVFAVTLNGLSSLLVSGSAHRFMTRNHGFDIANIVGFLTDPGFESHGLGRPRRTQ